MTNNSNNYFEQNADGDNVFVMNGTVKKNDETINSTGGELDTFAIAGQIISDISGANSVTFVSPIAGTVESAYSIVSGDPGAETDISMAVDGGADATAVLTVANGAAANEADSVTFADNNVVAVGSRVTLTSDAAATNAVSANMTVLLKTS